MKILEQRIPRDYPWALGSVRAEADCAYLTLPVRPNSETEPLIFRKGQEVVVRIALEETGILKITWERSP